MSEYILEMDNICKSFSGVQVLHHVNLKVRKGTLHALMGENGAGKSTLMKILIGAHRADSGTIRFNGEDLEPSTLTVHQALGKGISMIFQELCLVPDMSVAENIFIGREPKIGKTGIVDRKKLIRQTQELLDSFEITFLRPTDSLRGMSTAKMQMIEICKALSYHSKLIIMDEPTSSLTEDECKTLFRIVERLKRNGITFIFISHKMDEIYTVADEMTVLRDGMTIDCKPVNEMPMQELISKMVGREISTFFPPRDSQCGEKLLEVRGLTKAGKFQDISFSVHRGEILGFAGLVGAGRTEIMEALFGYNPADSGDIWLKGEQVKITRPRDAINRGMVMVTEDRKLTGLFLGLSISHNMVIPNLKSYLKGIAVSNAKINRTCKEGAEKFQVKMASLNQEVCHLSGGNQQKVVLARWMMLDPDIIILDEPTRGIDIGAKTQIYHLMRELAKQGKAIIMISSELPEVIGMSDNIVVMFEGKITGTLSGDGATQDEIMRYAQRKEYEFAMNPIPLYYKSYEYKDLGIEAPFIGVKFELIDGEAEIVPGVRVYPTPGHSPGHQAVEVDTKDGTYHCVGDAIFLLDNLKPVPQIHYDLTPTARFANIVEWWESVREIKRRCPDIKMVLPAHEPTLIERFKETPVLGL